MDNKKKVLFIGAAAGALAVVSLSVGLTIAYLMDSDNKKNTVKVGYGDQQISEQFTEPSIATMDSTNEKKVSVVNKSSVPVFARVYMNFSDSSVAEKADVTYTKNDSSTATVSWAEFLTAMEADDNGTDWKYIPESDANGELGGYFYYTKALEVTDDPDTADIKENQTTDIIDQVHVDFRAKDENNDPDTQDSNIDKIQPYEIIVYSEVVQTVETGYIYNAENSKIYGYDYNKEDNTQDEWEEAWKSYLTKNKKITTTP